jgi:hypothetical protein
LINSIAVEPKIYCNLGKRTHWDKKRQLPSKVVQITQLMNKVSKTLVLGLKMIIQ